MASDRLHVVGDDEYQPRWRDRTIIPWIIGGVLIAVLIAIAFVYPRIEQLGPSIDGEGHITVLPNGETWVFFLNGAQIRVTPESAKRLNAHSGPCANISGSLKDELPFFQIESLDCTPGGSMGEIISGRMQAMNMRYGYWPKDVEASGPSLAEAANTLEIVAAMIDERAEEPQLIPMYSAVFPATLLAARRAGAPPPLIIHIERNDDIVERLGRTDELAFLSQPRFMLAGAAPKGAWLVRSLDVVPAKGPPWLEQLLINPADDPWPKLLRQPTLSVASRSARPASDGSTH